MMNQAPTEAWSDSDQVWWEYGTWAVANLAAAQENRAKAEQYNLWAIHQRARSDGCNPKLIPRERPTACDSQSPQHQKRRGEAGVVGIGSATEVYGSGAPHLPFMGALAGGNTGCAFGMHGAYLPPTGAQGSPQFAGAGQVSATMHDVCGGAAGAQHDMHFTYQPAFRLMSCPIA
jgi:hypothetical protein